MEAIEYLSKWITYLLIIIPVSAAAIVTYWAAKKSFSVDQSDIEEANGKIRMVIKGAIIAESISGLITIIKSFYI